MGLLLVPPEVDESPLVEHQSARGTQDRTRDEAEKTATGRGLEVAGFCDVKGTSLAPFYHFGLVTLDGGKRMGPVFSSVL